MPAWAALEAWFEMIPSCVPSIFLQDSTPVEKQRTERAVLAKSKKLVGDHFRSRVGAETIKQYLTIASHPFSSQITGAV